MAHGNKAENKKKAKDGTDRGRPPGSPNRDYVVNQATAPRCQATREVEVNGKIERVTCNSTEFTDQRLVIARAIKGTSPHDGKPFNRIYNYNHKCVACGQWCKLIVYELVPVQEPSEEAGQDQPPEEISGDGRDHDASNPAEIENEDEFDDALDLDSILAAEDVGT